MPDAIPDMAVKLLEYGPLGLAALFLVLVFIILMRNEPSADAGLQRLRSRFLLAGVACFVLGILGSLAESFVGPPQGDYRASVTFSPGFAANKLPEPKIFLQPDGTPLTQDEPFTVSDDFTLKIGVDEIIHHSEALRTAAGEAVKINEALTARLRSLSAVAPDRAEAALSAEQAQRLSAANSGLKEAVSASNPQLILERAETLRRATEPPR